jgi:NTE family protein
MELINKDLALRETPLLAGLSDEEYAYIKERSSIVEYKKNQVIYKEGSPPSAFYCLISGRAVIYTQDQHGRQTVLEYLHRGKYFGIISLLTGEPHSVTAKTINDCLILIIKKEDFNPMLRRVPQLAIDLSQTLSRRLKRKDIHEKTIFESAVISVFSVNKKAGKSIYALNLALSLKAETNKSVAIIDICPRGKKHTMPKRLGMKGGYPVFDLCRRLATDSEIRDSMVKDKFGIDLIFLNYKPKEENCLKIVVDILSLLVNDYHYIILDLPSRMEKSVISILNQSDLIHVLTSPQTQDLKRTYRVIGKLERDYEFLKTKIKVIINEYKSSKLTFEEEKSLLSHDIFATLPGIECGLSDRLVLDKPECNYSKAIRRIARQEGDCQVGLALGVGVGYGLCHIGVLKVIEEEKIPIDIIAASSMGAVVASLWTTGTPAKEILEITKEFKEPKYIWGLLDFTLPLLGFIKGNKLYKFLKKHLGDKTFYDTRIPIKIIASDVKRKEPKILDKGLLVDAIMASCAMPGVFIPFTFKEEALFDGGVIHPLPTEPLIELGVKKIIAVNVTPSREDMLKQYKKMKEDYKEDIVKKGLPFSLKKYFKEKFRTNILDIIFSSIEIMQSDIAQREGLLADVVLHPDTSGLHWLELHKSEDFARRGEEEARKNLSKILKVVNE